MLFISELLKYMYKDHNMQLRTACGEAYNNTLASAHSYMVKTAVRASMYMLPTREQFLKSIHETGEPGHHCTLALLNAPSCRIVVSSTGYQSMVTKLLSCLLSWQRAAQRRMHQNSSQQQSTW